MRKSVSTFHVHAMGLCCLLVAGATVSSADEAPEAASADAHTPNMTCKPFPSSQEATPAESMERMRGHIYLWGRQHLPRRISLPATVMVSEYWRSSSSANPATP